LLFGWWSEASQAQSLDRKAICYSHKAGTMHPSDRPHRRPTNCFLDFIKGRPFHTRQIEPGYQLSAIDHYVGPVIALCYAIIRNLF